MLSFKVIVQNLYHAHKIAQTECPSEVDPDLVTKYQ